MQLMTKELEARFAHVGSQEATEGKNKVIVAKYFNPTGAGTWFATEYDPEEKVFFGYASIFGDHNDEWGYFSLLELEEVVGQFGLGIERDLHYGERKVSDEPIIK